MNKKLKQWRAEGRHLPRILRDFHDQKEVFKALHEMVRVEENSAVAEVTWITGQCYVIDCFLWFMARHGYTLQRSRAAVEFESLADNVNACTARRDQEFSQLLAQSITPPEDAPKDQKPQLGLSGLLSRFPPL